MSTIVTINSSDLITNSRADINTNFSNLNSGKVETSVIDTDTTLAANSDAKLPSQKAVKAYVDAGGNVNASETTKGIVEEATDAEVTAGTATGGTGAKLFITPAKLVTRLAAGLSPSSQASVSNGTNASISTPNGNIDFGSVTIPAGNLATTKGVRIRWYMDSITSSGGTWTLTAKNGSTVLFTLFTSTSTNVGQVMVELLFTNLGATNSQGLTSLLLSNTLTTNIQKNTSALDTTAAVTLKLNMAFTTGGANAFNLSHTTVEYI